MRLISIVPGFVLSVAAVSYSADASACSCIETAMILRSEPADGAVDVPTNAIPWVHFSGGVELLDAEGNLVPHTLSNTGSPGELCTSHAELLPTSELAPQSTYTIRVSDRFEEGSEPVAISFTTGSEPLIQDAPSPPSLNVALFDAQNYLNSCNGYRYQGCAAGNYEGLLEVTTLADGALARHDVLWSDGATGLFLDEGEDLCVELRARDLLGQRSEARVFCASAGELPIVPYDEVDLYPTCSREYVESRAATEDEEDVAPPVDSDDAEEGGLGDDEADESRVASSGCSISEGAPERGVAYGMLAALGAALALARRKSAPESR